MFWCIFPKPYSYITFAIDELNWMDVINNPINELSDDDEDYVYSKDTSFTDNDNNDYNENVDIECLFEMQRNYYESVGMTIQNTSSDGSRLSEKFQSSSANSEKN